MNLKHLFWKLWKQMAIKDLELYFLAVIKGEKKGIIPSFLKLILLILSFPFRFIVRIRNWLYDHGWFRSYTPPIPLVISIGNITTGGTGKTPVTLMLGKELEKLAPLAILSRGYRSLAETLSSPVLLHKKGGITHPATLCGDEALLLSENLEDAFVVVGKDRYQSSKLAARMGAEILLLDDAMQHRGIARDLEIVVMDLQDPFGQGYFLPRGLLREGKSSLARADLIILNNADHPEKLEKLKRTISQVTSAPIIATQVEVVGVFDFNGDKLGSLENEKVGIFCGIANPHHFRKTVQNLGAEIVQELFLRDHDKLDMNRLVDFSKSSENVSAKWVLCTEKDRVKLNSFKGGHLPIGCVKTHLKIIEGESQFQAFITQAKRMVKEKY